MKLSGDALTSALASATDGLLFPSETDSAVVPFSHSGGDVKLSAAVDALKLGSYPEGTPASAQSVDRFFKPAVEIKDWFGDEEKARAERFASLVALLKENLTGLRAYKVGRPTSDVYIVGKTATGDLAGVKTSVVET